MGVEGTGDLEGVVGTGDLGMKWEWGDDAIGWDLKVPLVYNGGGWWPRKGVPCGSGHDAPGIS